MKILAVVVMILCLAAPLSATKTYGDLEFQTNFDSLKQISHDKNQAMVIKFYTDW